MAASSGEALPQKSNRCETEPGLSHARLFSALLGVVLLVPGILSAACRQSTATRRTEQFIPVAPKTVVRVRVSTGYISVAAGRVGMVSMEVFSKVRALWGAQGKLGSIRVVASKKRGELLVQGTSPKSSGSAKYHMHLHITVPPDTPLFLATGSGHMTLTNLLGDVEATTGSGEVRARGIAGRVKLHTGEGNITLRGTPKRFVLTTGVGSVSLWLRPETRLSGPSEASTDSGNLTLHASPRLDGLITARVRTGSIHCDFPTQGMGGRRVRARLGSGRTPILLSSRKGNVSLKRW